MSREAIGPYILSWPNNLVISVDFIFSKGYIRTQGIRVTYRQKIIGGTQYFYVKSYLEFQLIKFNELRSPFFWHTFA